MVSAAQTFAAWLEACASTHKGPCASNALRIEGAVYYLDPHPRRQDNGALVGRIHKHVKHAGARAIGGFKIAPDGTVARIPAELAALLPGAAGAEQDDDAEAATK